MKPQGMSEVALKQLATVHVAGGTANPIVGIETRKKKMKASGSLLERERERERERETEVNSRTGLLRIRVITCLRERAVARTVHEVEHGMAPGCFLGPSIFQSLRKRRRGRPRLMGTSSGQHRVDEIARSRRRNFS